MKSILPRTIQARLIFSHMLVSLISIALISIYAGQVLFTAARREVEHHYEDLAFAAANEIEQVFSEYLVGQAPLERVVNSMQTILGDQSEVSYTLYLPDGAPVLDSSGTLPAPATQATAPEIFEAAVSKVGESEYFRWNFESGEILYLAVSVEHDHVVYGILHFRIPLTESVNPARRSLSLLIASALLVGLGMSVFGYYLSHSLAGPIRTITLTAESLARGEMGARVLPPNEPQEIHRLAEAFNNMAGRLQNHVDELRSFVANASHELRTPLTSIKLRVEALRSGALEDLPVTQQFLAEIEGEVDRLSNMVNDLLDLSRIEAGLEASKRLPVNLTMVANDVYEAFKVRAERAGIALTARVQPDIPSVVGNEDQLRRMLYNLVDNAIKYTPHGGQVEISLQIGERQGTLLLMVRDTGFGIQAAQLPHIFERFYRVEATRPRYGPSQGSGLGLPIAKTIVETHGGQIGVTSQPGKGTTFWVELPARLPA